MLALFKYYPILDSTIAKNHAKDYRKNSVETLCSAYRKLEERQDETLILFLEEFHAAIGYVNKCEHSTNHMQSLLATHLEALSQHPHYDTIKPIIEECQFSLNNESTIVKSRHINMAKNKRTNIALYATLLALIPSALAATGIIVYFTSPLGVPSLFVAGIIMAAVLLTQTLYWYLKAAEYVDLTQKIAHNDFEADLGTGYAIRPEHLPLSPTINKASKPNSVKETTTPCAPQTESVQDIIEEIRTNTVKMFSEEAPAFIANAREQLWSGFSSLVTAVKDKADSSGSSYKF